VVMCESTRTRTRITQFDGLRAVAVTAVFLHHAFHAKLLWMGVDVFFVLSGFLITGILLNSKEETSFTRYIGTFYERRARRILPAYSVLLVITAALFGAAFLSHWYLYLGAMNFIQPFKIDSPATLQPLWSLAVEEQFYLVWPLAVYYLSRKSLLKCAAGIVLLAPVLRYACTPFFPTPWAVYMLLPFRMDCLAAGALFALLKDRIMPVNKGYGWLGSIPILAAIGYLVLLEKQGYSKSGNTPFGNLAIYETTLLISAVVVWMVLVGVGKGLLSSRVLVWLGTISLSLYLIHTTCLYLAPHSVTLAAASAIVYASCMWLAVERRILSRSSKARRVLNLREAVGAVAGEPQLHTGSLD